MNRIDEGGRNESGQNLVRRLLESLGEMTGIRIDRASTEQQERRPLGEGDSRSESARLDDAVNRASLASADSVASPNQHKEDDCPPKKGDLVFDFSSDCSVFVIKERSWDWSYEDYYRFGNDDGELMEIKVKRGKACYIDFMWGSATEMGFYPPSLEAAKPCRLFYLSPDTTLDDDELDEREDDYAHDFRILFDKKELTIIFSDRLDEITHYYEQGRVVYYGTGGPMSGVTMIMKIRNLTEEEYLGIKSSRLP